MPRNQSPVRSPAEDCPRDPVVAAQGLATRVVASRGFRDPRGEQKSCHPRRGARFSSGAQETLAGAAADALPGMEHNAKRADRLQVASINAVSKHGATTAATPAGVGWPAAGGKRRGEFAVAIGTERRSARRRRFSDSSTPEASPSFANSSAPTNPPARSWSRSDRIVMMFTLAGVNDYTRLCVHAGPERRMIVVSVSATPWRTRSVRSSVSSSAVSMHATRSW